MKQSELRKIIREEIQKTQSRQKMRDLSKSAKEETEKIKQLMKSKGYDV